jgi:hypothetical protein
MRIGVGCGLIFLRPLPQTHLARFVVEVMDRLDLRARSRRGALPSIAVASVPFYGYATGVSSSRKLERATYDSAIATFRRSLLKLIEALFVQALLLARGVATRRGEAPLSPNFAGCNS